ncbi:uncharacterized protein LOC144100000 [Amblyomma americanum]
MVGKTAVLSFALVLIFISANAKAQCTTTQLPNVLGLDACLGLTPDYCSERPENATQEVIQIFSCVFRTLPQVTQPIQAFFQLRTLVAGVLSRVNSDGNPLSVANMLCNPLGLPLFRCENAFSTNIRCGPPINISLPTSFGINNCTNDTRLMCMEGDPLSNETMSELVKFLACLLSRSPSGGETLAKRLACTLAQLVQLSAQQFAATFPLPLLAAGVQMAAARLSAALAIRALCF